MQRFYDKFDGLLRMVIVRRMQMSASRSGTKNRGAMVGMIKNGTNLSKVQEKGVLNLLGESNNKGNIDSQVEQSVENLQAFVKMNEVQESYTEKRLTYILDSFGVGAHKNLNSRQRRLLERLMHFKGEKQTLDIIKRTRIQDDLMVILSHLIFCGHLEVRSLTAIIMRLDLERVIKVHQKLGTNPELVRYWFTDPEVQMKCEIAIASRYLMLRSRMMAAFIVQECLTKNWLPKIKAGVFNDAAYMRNMVHLIKTMTDETNIADSVIECDNASLAYCFWEAHPMNSEMKEFLMTKKDSLNAYQRIIVDYVSNPIISGSRRYSLRLRRLSERMHLSAYEPAGRRNNDKFVSSIELLLANLREDKDVDKECYEEMSKQLMQFQDSEKQDKDKHKVIYEAYAS